MQDNSSSEYQKKLDLELFFSSHSENELNQLKDIIDKLLSKKQKEKQVSVPISIFSSSLNPGEVLIKFLKENKNLRFCEISKLINKKENAIWLNYKRAAEKKKESFAVDVHEELSIPIYVFKTQNLSYLESIVIYLRDENHLSNNAISKLLNKSPQVLSISYNRAKAKLKNG